MASKSLGTLTLDLVAKVGGFVQGMDKAQRESAKWRKQVDRDLQAIGKGISRAAAAGAAAAAAGTAAMVALTKRGIEAVSSQANLARSLDTTYDSITALNLAAGDVGLEGLEGSITRLNRRLGAAEFGAGAAATAVKALNLDLDALSRMDVDERVATIADAIRDSGVSMQRAARFAQDLGFEQQQAAAFFMQGGDAIRSYRGEVDRLGLSLSDVDAAKVREAVNAMGIFGDLTSVVSQRLAVEFSPLIRQVAQDIEGAAKETGGFHDEVSELVDTTVHAAAFVASSVDGVRVVFNTVGKSIALIFLTINQKAYEFADAIYNGPVGAINKLIEVANRVPGVNIEPRGLAGFGKKVREELSVLTIAIEEAKSDIQAGLLDPLAGQRLIEYYENAKAAAENAAEASLAAHEAVTRRGGLGFPDANGAREEAERRAKAIADEVAALELQAKQVGMTADEITLYNLAAKGAGPAQLEMARAALETVAAFERQQEMLMQAQIVIDSLATAEERFASEHQKLDALFEAGLLTWDQYSEAVLNAAEQLDGIPDLTKDATNEMNEFAVQAARNIQSHMADFLFDPFEDGLEGMLQGFVDVLRRMAAEALAAKLAEKMFGDLLTGGGNTGWIGAAFGALVKHDGGRVDGSGPKRSVSPLLFANAPRLHNGLKADEFPAILQRGEEVLARDDPRNSANGGGAGGAINIINTIDPAEMVSAGLATPAGERVIMNVISRNAQKIRTALG